MKIDTIKIKKCEHTSIPQSLPLIINDLPVYIVSKELVFVRYNDSVYRIDFSDNSEHDFFMNNYIYSFGDFLMMYEL